MNTKDLKTLKKLAVNIASGAGMSVGSQYRKFTELAYLCHFVQCYRPSMHIAGWQRHPVYIMEDAGTKTGIAFCDLQLPLNLTTDYEAPISGDSINSDIQDIAELWLVLVTGDIMKRKSFFLDLIKVHQLSTTFDKIFLFDFFQSIIQVIK
ncbi:hypothetical protein ACFGVS_08235 [Mucilaginibacter sp. AW1-7]|jgi:hypothetical protein|uniref:hypothetical protein n=1 Tax=Mucilaginibacter sp. AW1-7 TaxID=3349874 RepID=UPI003F73BAF0